MRRAWMIIAIVIALTIPYAVAQQSGAQASMQTSATDATLQTKVQSKLASDAAFKSVVVSVRNGVVDLTGTVPSEPDQKRAKESVSQVAGVKNVTDHLAIGEVGAAASAGAAVPQTAQSETSKNTAGSIAGNAGAIGTTTGDTTPTNPAVTTHSAAGNGAPTGMSVQDSQTQSSQNLKSNGASGLGMTPDTDSNTLRSEIDSALKSDPTLANSQLSVDVSDTQITLSGSVPSGKEKQTAVRIAQSYAGNRRVSDKVSLAGKQASPNPQSTQPNAMGTNPK